MKKIIVLLTFLFILTSCKSPEFLKLSKDEYPIVDGSTATIPLAISLRAKITGENIEDLKNSTTHTKTTESFSNLINGNADLLLVYTPLQSVLEESKDQIEIKPIGKDALVFFTNKENTVTDLSTAQIQDIYQGKTKSWSELGGSDSEIIAYQRNEDSGSQVLMRKLVMKDLQMVEPEIELLEMAMGEIVEAVAGYKNNQNSIGYSVYYYLKAFIDDGENIKMFNVDGIEPNNDNIANGKYPFSEDFYVVIKKSEKQDSPARKIFNILTTQEGKDFINSCGYVAIK